MRFAGTFYPSDKEELERVVNKYLIGERNENIKAGIVPHAGYKFSGRLMGEVISIFPQKKNFILIGVNHSGVEGRINLSLKDFKTPLGEVKINKELVNKIIGRLNKRGLDAGASEESHKKEHSLEVLLPFLQLSQKEFKIIPILLKNLSFEDCCKFGEILSKSKKIGVIVSSDLTHYGRNYNFTPFSNNIREKMYNLDNKIIEKILVKNPSGVYNLAGKSTVCGRSGLTVITRIAELNNWEVKKIGYYTSGDITNNWSSVVGYGGVVFL
jgi:hypothetical protein